MSQRFHALVLSAALTFATLLAAPALAQGGPAEPPSPVEPPHDTPRAQRGDPAKNLDRLFAALRVAPTNESAKFVEGNIWGIVTASRASPV